MAFTLHFDTTVLRKSRTNQTLKRNLGKLGPDTYQPWMSLLPTTPFRTQIADFPGGAVVKNPPANAGDTRSSPGPVRSHMPRGN